MPAGGGGKDCIPGNGATGRLGPAVGRLMGGIRPAASRGAVTGNSGFTGNAGAGAADGT